MCLCRTRGDGDVPPFPPALTGAASGAFNASTTTCTDADLPNDAFTFTACGDTCRPGSVRPDSLREWVSSRYNPSTEIPGEVAACGFRVGVGRPQRRGVNLQHQRRSRHSDGGVGGDEQGLQSTVRPVVQCSERVGDGDDARSGDLRC